MGVFVMMTRLTPGAVRPDELEKLEAKVMDKVRSECPDVSWVGSYAVLGPYDYLDIFTAPDNETAEKVAVIVRMFGHATTEIWPATEWDRFKELIRGITGKAA